MIIATNFKSNLTRAKTAAYMKELNTFIESNNITQELFVFPPSSALDSFDTTVNIGVQNAYATQNGAFTGELALDQIEEFGIKTILIGHSERRHALGESQELISQKFNFYKKQGFKIIYCIGEPLEVREAGNDALMDYLSEQFVGIDSTYEEMTIAYEPVWAIGTGLTPENGEIDLIQGVLKDKYNQDVLYGGSVKVANAKSILELKNVDGILVGSGALNVEDFKAMITIAQNLENSK